MEELKKDNLNIDAKYENLIKEKIRNYSNSFEEDIENEKLILYSKNISNTEQISKYETTILKKEEIIKEKEKEIENLKNESEEKDEEILKLRKIMKNFNSTLESLFFLHFI